VIMKFTTHIYYAIATITFLVSPVYGIAQTQPVPKTTMISSNGDKKAAPISIRDEQGKILTHQQMFALTSTGDYKMIEMKGKDNKPYYLVKKAPGFGPKPVAAPVVVKP